MWAVSLSQGPRAGSPPLPPSPRLRHGGKVAVASGAERTPRSEENRCPALVHSTGLGSSVPTGTKRAGPRPAPGARERGVPIPSHPHPRPSPHPPGLRGATLRARSPRPSADAHGCGALAQSTGSASKEHGELGHRVSPPSRVPGPTHRCVALPARTSAFCKAGYPRPHSASGAPDSENSAPVTMRLRLGAGEISFSLPGSRRGPAWGAARQNS